MNNVFFPRRGIGIGNDTYLHIRRLLISIRERLAVPCFSQPMTDAKKFADIAHSLREGAAMNGPLNRRAQMILLAEHFENLAEEAQSHTVDMLRVRTAA